MTPRIGVRAPEFTLVDGAREQYTLESFPGKLLVMAFYPLAFTGG